MRRPRGPGGRFLTAEEIAAQKTAQGLGSVHSPSHDNDDEGEDEEAPPIRLDEGQHLARDPYQDAGSLANALSPNPRQHIPQPPPQAQQIQYATNLPVGNNPVTLQSYPTMTHPPSMHYSNGLYPNTDGISDTEMRRRTE